MREYKKGCIERLQNLTYRAIYGIWSTSTMCGKFFSIILILSRLSCGKVKEADGSYMGNRRSCGAVDHFETVVMGGH